MQVKKFINFELFIKYKSELKFVLFFMVQTLYMSFMIDTLKV